MFICHCLAVTDREIRASIEAGARDVPAIGERCGAGTGCGGCHLELRRMLAEYGLGDLERTRLKRRGRAA